jgi:uncharacterized protein YjbI with pentapeptide repeats
MLGRTVPRTADRDSPSPAHPRRDATAASRALTIPAPTCQAILETANLETANLETANLETRYLLARAARLL